MTEQGRGRTEGGERTHTVMLIPDGGRRTRTFRVPHARVRWLAAGAVLVALAGAVMIGSWGYLVMRANRARILEEEVAELLAREDRVESLAQSLVEVQAAYEQLRGLFGSTAVPEARDIWLPPSTRRPRGSRSPGTEQPDLPTGWPLTERGFVTQAVLAGGAGDHPGIDIAIPTGSYVRAAGSGAVAETGDDRVYGNFVVLDHGMGYRTRYAHASLILVSEGETVRRNEVIALTGSSGRSTAPHLHFEILQEGEAIDPLTLVAQP